MSKRIQQAVALVLCGGGLAAVSTGATATDKAGAIYSDSSEGSNIAAGNVANFAWDGENSSKGTPNVFGGTSRLLGWAHNSKWYDLKIKEKGNYTIRMIRTNPDQKAFNPAFSLWPVGDLPFDFDNCKGHCGDTVDFKGTHSYNQVSGPTQTNANAWMLGPTGPAVNPKGETLSGTLRWTPKPGTGPVTGFIGYANSGPTGWENGMPENAVPKTNDYNVSQDRNLVTAGLVNTAAGGGLGGTTLDPKSKACVPKIGGKAEFNGVAALNLYGAEAGHYLIVLGGSCNREQDKTNCSPGSGDYLLEIVKLDSDNPQASASTTTPRIRANKSVVLSGNESFDPVKCDLDYEWKQTDSTGQAITLDKTAPHPKFTAPVEAVGKTLTFAVTVKNADGLTKTSQDVAVAVTNDNDPPVIKVTTPQPGNEQTSYTLNSSATDPNGDGIKSYEWKQTAGPTVVLQNANTKSLSFMAPTVASGSVVLSFELTASDDYDLNPKSAKTLANVTINNDDTLVDCSGATASNPSLWPANKKFKTVTIGGITGLAASYGLTVTGVTSSEPVKSKAAKDSTGPDARIVRGKKSRKTPRAVDSVQLRAERQATGSGRVYTVSFSATDGANSCQGQAKVEVPIAPGMNALDGGGSYNAAKSK